MNTPFVFSEGTFTQLLLVLKQAKYFFARFEDVSGAASKSYERVCLLRHDVDVSMDFALDMARIEAAHGVRSTYFVMLRSPVYNLMSRHGTKVLEELMSLGHEIGLHFDVAPALEAGKSLPDQIALELRFLSELSSRKVHAFSFHQPKDVAIKMQVSLPDVINTYHPKQLQGYYYISDSNRTWRDVDPFELIEREETLVHILLHPVWWMCSHLDVKDCWDQAIKRNFDSAQVQLLQTERAYGPARKLVFER
jgi:hypothetical protein